MSASVAASSLYGIGADFLLNNGVLKETAGPRLGIQASNVQGLYQSKDSAGDYIAFDRANGYLNEFSPRQGWVPITLASQVVQDSYLDVFALNGSTLVKATGVPSSVNGRGYGVVATGVTRLAADKAGEVVALEGPSTYAYFNGAIGSRGSATGTQYALDGHGDLYSLNGGVLSMATSELSAPSVLARGVTEMAMDAANEVVVTEGLHSYYYYTGLVGSHGSSPTALYSLDTLGWLFTLQNGVVTYATTSVSKPTTFGFSGIAAADGSFWFLTIATTGNPADHYIYRLNNEMLTSYGFTTVAIGAKWLSLGGPASALGIPAGSVMAAPDGSNNPNDLIENFANGSIYSPATGGLQVWITSPSSGFGLTGSTPFTINKDDIEQQGANDCAFLASLASVAQADPSFLYSHIKQDDSSPTGLWDVKLFVNGSWNTYRIAIGNPITTTINGQTYTVDPNPTPIVGQTTYTGSKDQVNQNMWVVAYQRAYLQAMGVSAPAAVTDNGAFWQYPNFALETITGIAPGNSVWTAGQPPSWLTPSSLLSLLKQNEAVTASTPSSSANVWVQGECTLVGSHQYSVVGVFLPTVSGQTPTVLLRNPWADDPQGNQNDGNFNDKSDPTSLKADGGYLFISWSEFVKEFIQLDYGTP